jgi:Protein of unknown function (DUF3144)
VSSKHSVDDDFWNRADAHIALANSQSKSTDAGKVSASFLYAAARFNAFIVASGQPDAKSLAANKAEAIDYFTKQFRKMLDENLSDHVENFGKYLATVKGKDA